MLFFVIYIYRLQNGVEVECLLHRRVTRAWKFLFKSRKWPNAPTKMAVTRTALFSRFQHAFRDIIRQLSNSELDEDGVDSIIFRLEQLSIHLVRLCNVDLMNNQTERLISNTIMLVRSYNDVNRQASSFQLERNLNGTRDRPRFSISSEQLQYLLNYDLMRQILLKHLAFQEVPYSDVCAHLVYLCVKE
jgi:hypothetical protein